MGRCKQYTPTPIYLACFVVCCFAFLCFDLHVLLRFALLCLICFALLALFCFALHCFTSLCSVCFALHCPLRWLHLVVAVCRLIASCACKWLLLLEVDECRCCANFVGWQLLGAEGRKWSRSFGHRSVQGKAPNDQSDETTCTPRTRTISKRQNMHHIGAPQHRATITTTTTTTTRGE